MSTETTQPKADPRPAELDAAFHPWQVGLLKQPVPPKLLHSRNQGGKELSYIAGHDAIAMANGVFGVGNWSYTTASVWCVGAVYHALVTLQVHTPSGQIVERGDLGTCDVQGWRPGQEPNINAVQQAAKGSVTDGLKRCLRTFGPFFGLDLYDEDGPAQHPAPRTPAQPAAQRPASAVSPMDVRPGADGTWDSLAPDAPQQTGEGECPTCGAAMVYKEGTSKAGKAYAGYFCSDRNCKQPPIWAEAAR
jgi:hypothetical protein